MTQSPHRKRLATPLNIGSMTVAGRLFKSATSETRASADGFVTDELLAFYEPMAEAGTPLIVTGNLYVSPQGKSAGRQAGIDADDKLPGLREWTGLARRHEVRIVAQLNHGGRQIAEAAPGADRIVSASDVREPLYGTKPSPLRSDEMPGVVESFVAAGERAREAGFDGVQIHAAHGYLLSQFLTPHTNHRTDAYGGSLDNRARLLVEVLKGLRARLGDDYPVLVKINGTDDLPFRRGATTEELVRVAVRLQDEGVDAVEISRGHYESWPGMIQGKYRGFIRTSLAQGAGQHLSGRRRAATLAVAPVVERVAERLRPPLEGFNLPQAEHFTRALDVPVICVGGFHTRTGMEAAIGGGRTDAVSAARAMIADPHLYRNVLGDVAERPVCGYCNGCIARFSGLPVDCYSDEIRRDRDVMIEKYRTRTGE
ncbi:NADH:flavin oxidoreductase [Streptomyces arenae]|uniref:NADH:flavin oxidoreductase n=1 Tax=Streptomyces arenae TaxID=29301 RepID=UPI00265989B8|nr:NADH:flavin oxidoreductase [Streptomyces arenae]MCG7204772.1 NADH:flavin oxidoreductase [Streptomyces arenae]